jgi:hypothetical protein
MSDLIAAIATGSIAAAIGIVRVSGDGCFAACDRVFRPRNGVPFAQQPSHKMVFGEMLDDSGAVIDQGLAVRFGGGHSYTGEDSAEFHCHGSPVVLHTLLSALFAAGARQAQAGEFTKRAFLNGKMDLTEAEAARQLQMWGVNPTKWTKKLSARHIFTHVRWEMTGYVVEVNGLGPGDWLWAEAQQRERLAIPSAFEKFTAELKEGE